MHLSVAEKLLPSQEKKSQQAPEDLANLAPAWRTGAKGIELPLQKEVADKVSVFPLRPYAKTSGTDRISKGRLSRRSRRIRQLWRVFLLDLAKRGGESKREGVKTLGASSPAGSYEDHRPNVPEG